MKTASKILLFLIFMLLLGLGGATASAQEDLGAKYCKGVEKKYGLLPPDAEYDRVVGPKAYYIEITGVIDYALADYVRLAVERAERDNAVLVLLLDTPGGFLDAALDIVTTINMEADVPVVAFVVNRWAESAGTLILVTSHVAAMQPGTIIGSMQPVAYNPSTGSYQPINESKILNPIIEILCQHGASKGRNATALVRFVLFNDNYGADVALRYNVIDLVADDMSDLLRKLNGTVVALPTGDRVKLVLSGEYEEVPPPPRVVILHALSDPLLSGLLLSLGMLIVLFSLASGHYASAGLGALLLILGLAGSGFNPNLTSLILIILGVILVLVELYTPGFGLIGGTGIVMLVLGIALLPTGGGGFAVSPVYARRLILTIYAIGAFFGGVTAFAVYKILQVRRKKPLVWTIEGARGRALDRITPDTPGFVIVEGEYWKARSAGETIEPGEEVEVVGKEGPVLIVRKAGSRPAPQQPS